MSGTGDADLDDGSSSFDFIDNETAAYGDQNGSDETTDTPSNGVVTGEPEICHIDGGQADSTLIITPTGDTILIDMGNWRPDGEEVIAHREADDVDRIDHLLATHAHADHIGGYAAVIEWAETEGEGIGAADDSGFPTSSVTYERDLVASSTSSMASTKVSIPSP